MLDIQTFHSSLGVDIALANELRKQIITEPRSVLVLPTGNTPVGAYALLQEYYLVEPFQTDTLKIFNLDEYYPLPQHHSFSYYTFMKEHVIDPLHIPHDPWHIPSSEAQHADIEADRYNELLAQYPLDLAVLGIGPGLTCHIGFNEPGSPKDSVTRYVELNEKTKEVNRKLFDDPADMPHGAITMGIGNILSAKKIILVAKGAGKAEGIQRSLQGVVSVDAPASFLQEHPNVVALLDKEAASLLK